VLGAEDAVPKLARLAYYKYRAANLTFGFNTHVIRARVRARVRARGWTLGFNTHVIRVRVRVRGWTSGFNTRVTAHLSPNRNPDPDPSPHRIGRPSPTLT